MDNLQRIDAHRVKIQNPYGIDATLFANEQVFVDRQSVDQLIKVLGISETLKRLSRLGFFGPQGASLGRVVNTPDFHKGGDIPIGTVAETDGCVVPGMVGTDIACGMRMIVTDVTIDEFLGLGTALDDRLRHIFFQGGRNIPMSARQRTAMFRHGLPGLLEEQHAGDGIWAYWDRDQQEADAMRTHQVGSWATTGVFGLDDFIQGSGEAFTRDDQIGSIGGGNHFVEIQRVEEVLDGPTAHAWGLKPGYLTIMAHTGSVSIGHMVGKHFNDLAKAAYPTDLKHDDSGFHALPLDGPHGHLGRSYLSAMGNAANFAVTNRLFLGLMTIRALAESLGREVGHRLVYDAPHNLVWTGEGRTAIHRKGACPAYGPSQDADFPYGHPVIIPGSMGSSSWIMRGHGSAECLCSACHGAGRMAPRKSARKAKPDDLSSLRIVTKVDPRGLRRDIAETYVQSLLEEAPSMYKPVDPVIDSVVGADIASKVARTWPLMTIKGI